MKKMLTLFNSRLKTVPVDLSQLNAKSRVTKSYIEIIVSSEYNQLFYIGGKLFPKLKMVYLENCQNQSERGGSYIHGLGSTVMTLFLDLCSKNKIKFLWGDLVTSDWDNPVISNLKPIYTRLLNNSLIQYFRPLYDKYFFKPSIKKNISFYSKFDFKIILNKKLKKGRIELFL